MPYCSVNSIRIYYEISGAGFPLLLIHANPFDHRLWLYQIASFSTFFQVIAVDLRGYGHSDKPTSKTSLAMMAEDVLGVCRKEELKEAIVAGISVGGNVALQLSLTVTTTKLKEQPDQIRRAIRATLQGTSYFKKNRSEMVPFISRKLDVDTKEADELFDLGVKVFSNNGKISDEGLSVLLRQRDPRRQMRVKPSDFVDWSLLPGKTD